jgi:hypothetical protein
VICESSSSLLPPALMLWFIWEAKGMFGDMGKSGNEMGLVFFSQEVFDIHFGANENWLNFSNIYTKSVIPLDKK